MQTVHLIVVRDSLYLSCRTHPHYACLLMKMPNQLLSMHLARYQLIGYMMSRLASTMTLPWV